METERDRRRTWRTGRPARRGPDPAGPLDQIAESAVSAAGGPLGSTYELRHGEIGTTRIVGLLYATGRGIGPWTSVVVDLETGEELHVCSTDPDWRARRLHAGELPANVLAHWPRDDRGRPIASTHDTTIAESTLRRIARKVTPAEPAQMGLFA